MNLLAPSATVRGLVLAIAAAWSCAPAPAEGAVAVEIGTFENPTYVAVAPGEPDLLFVVERAGRIQVLKDERPLDASFLDISELVFGPPDTGAGGEQGLFSVAFPRNYDTSRRFYVAFTNNLGEFEVDEFQRFASTPLQADPSTRRVLLTIPHSGALNHYGGQMHFGPDDLLYISTGDGGNLTPPGEPARDLENLLGKILRIRPVAIGGRPYGIPQGNPFVGRAGRDEILAYGLRNPWRFSFDRGRIAIADVGQNQLEEVNFLHLRDAFGVNFGWPQFEGNLVFDNTRPGPDPATFPMFVYDHTEDRCAIIGGYVVRDPNLPELWGRYVYGDSCTGEVRSFVPRVDVQQAALDAPTGITLPGLSTFGEGFGGKVYAAQIAGGVWRLAPGP